MRLTWRLLYLCLLFPATAHAYSDPGSGIMLWQLAVSFFIGLAFNFRRALGFLSKLLKKDEK